MSCCLDPWRRAVSHVDSWQQAVSDVMSASFMLCLSRLVSHASNDHTVPSKAPSVPGQKKPNPHWFGKCNEQDMTEIQHHEVIFTYPSRSACRVFAKDLSVIPTVEWVWMLWRSQQQLFFKGSLPARTGIPASPLMIVGLSSLGCSGWWVRSPSQIPKLHRYKLALHLASLVLLISSVSLRRDLHEGRPE